MKNRTIHRIRIALFFGLLLGGAGILMFLLWPRSVPLLSIARPLAWNATDPYDDSPHYGWLSDTDILSFRHHPPNTPNTEPPVCASRWSLTTNTETEIPALTHILQSEPGDGPFLQSISPDGRRVLWTNPVSATHHFYSAFVDGHGLVDVHAKLVKAYAPGYEEMMLWMGDGHTLLQVGIPYREDPLPQQQFGWLLDLEKPERVRRIPAASGGDFYAAQTITATPDNRLLVVFNESPPLGYIRETHMEERCVDSEVKRVRQWAVRLPPNAWSFETHFSPRTDRITWLFSIKQQSPLDLLLHRWFPRHPVPFRRQQELWISHADGSDMRYIGELPFKLNPKDGMMEIEEIERMQWLPNGKQISFLCDHRLYLLNVPSF